MYGLLYIYVIVSGFDFDFVFLLLTNILAGKSISYFFILQYVSTSGGEVCYVWLCCYCWVVMGEIVLTCNRCTALQELILTENILTVSAVLTLFTPFIFHSLLLQFLAWHFIRPLSHWKSIFKFCFKIKIWKFSSEINFWKSYVNNIANALFDVCTHWLRTNQSAS